MKTEVNEELREQAALYRFRFSCENCAYFVEETRSCSEGYPVDEHLDGSLAGPLLLFCKLFEGA